MRAAAVAHAVAELSNPQRPMVVELPLVDGDQDLGDEPALPSQVMADSARVTGEERARLPADLRLASRTGRPRCCTYRALVSAAFVAASRGEGGYQC
jgi:hypothetical protein